MTNTPCRKATASLPVAPRNPLPLRRQLNALRRFHTGVEELRDAGGYVTRITFAPRWMLPEMVIVTSPQGAHDVLGLSDAIVERNAVHEEMRNQIGANLFVVRHEQWLPRRRLLQPIFTKKNVQNFTGAMSQAAEGIAASWPPGGVIDLDAQCRKVTMRALGRSVLGLDLDEESDRIAEPMRVMLRYVADRGVAPVRLPRWVPTPRQRRARAASATLRALAADVLDGCRRDPGRDAPLVRALMAATDPATGRGLTDAEIADELVVFIGAGHDTTATTMAYALWQLGLHPEMQDRVRREVDAIGDRQLEPGDVGHLGYTLQVLHEALRMCPPAAINGRMATEDIAVDGYRVAAGTLVAVGVYAMQRDPALWDRPNEFDPDRFRPDLAKSLDRWQYIPFGAGPRTCIGDHFAMLELALALATIVRTVEIHSREPEFPMATPFTTTAAAPILARVTGRPSYTTENPAGSAARPVSASSTASP
ncbi:cytochrome P450 [Mycolicibacterium arabiense]|nr:cytochrome P450 [Mycolicibacterium arabiense]MCV7372470.1 cytochrome P450 [Mycolicibacterium arabiense]